MEVEQALNLNCLSEEARVKYESKAIEKATLPAGTRPASPTLSFCPKELLDADKGAITSKANIEKDKAENEQGRNTQTQSEKYQTTNREEPPKMRQRIEKEAKPDHCQNHNQTRLHAKTHGENCGT